MKTLSRLSDECKKCSHVDDCDDKRMVACAMREWEPNIIVDVKNPITMPIKQPTLRVDHPITINMGEYMPINMSIEEITERVAEEIKKAFKIQCAYNKS